MNRKQKLTSKTGAVKFAVVTYHARNDAAQTTRCGRTFAEMRAAEFPVDQPTACGEGSDVNCPHCA